MSSSESSSLVSKSTSAESSSSAALDNSNAEISLVKKKHSLPSFNLSNDSRELKANSSKGRVVPSRYKTAAIEASKKGKLTLGNSNPSLNRSSSNEVIKPDQRPIQKRGLLASAANVLKSDYLLPNRHLPKDLQRELQTQKPIKKVSIMPNPKLHSTALNNTTLLDKTSCGPCDIFSSTVVGGEHQRNFTSLTGLSDISTISTVSPVNGTPSECLFRNVAEEFPSVNPIENVALMVDEPCDYSEEEIAAEHLRYLTWALIDINSEDKYKLQLTEAERQVCFLTSLVEEQQNALLEEKKSLALLDHYEKISKDYYTTKELLQKLEASVEPCENRLELLTSNLEIQLNKINLKNIHIPTDQKHFEDGLSNVLDENRNLLSQINSLMKSERTRNETLFALSNDINECIDTANPCLSELQQLANAVIQETSLSFTINKINENHVNDEEL